MSAKRKAEENGTKAEKKLKNSDEEKKEITNGCGKKNTDDKLGLHPFLEVRKSPIGGHGIFAIRKIKKDEVLWEGTGAIQEQILTAEEILKLPKETRIDFFRFSYQISANTFSAPIHLDNLWEDPGYFMNHSCDPNGWFEGASKTTARRDIEPEEEVTYDYATSESYHWPSLELTEGETVNCMCGATTCRGSVLPDDWKQPHLRKLYRGHFAPYLNDLITQEEEEAAKKSHPQPQSTAESEGTAPTTTT